MDGQLSDIDEGLLISGLGVQGIHLRKSSLHEVDHGEHVGRCELAVLYIGNVHLLQKKKKEKPVRIECYRKKQQHRTAAHLENSVEICFLFVSADFIEGQESKNPTCLLPCAPLLQ